MSGRSRPRTFASATLVLTGLGLLAHPSYFERLSIYPGTGWEFLPMFHAAFTALGVVTVASGLFLAGGRRALDRHVAVLVGATIVLVPLYGIVLLGVTGVDGGTMDGYGAKRSLVGGLVAATFLLGFAVGSGRRRPAALGLAALLAPLGLVVLEWRTGALLGPVVDLFILLTTASILGVSYLGTGILLAAGVLGVCVGSTERSAASQSSEPAGLPGDTTVDRRE